MDACEKDNTFRFNKSGTYEISEGATKCDSADPQVAEQGTWSITGDDLIITESGDTPESIKITELTKSKLVLTLTVTYMNDTYVEVLTFNAQ